MAEVTAMIDAEKVKLEAASAEADNMFQTMKTTEARVRLAYRRSDAKTGRLSNRAAFGDYLDRSTATFTKAVSSDAGPTAVEITNTAIEDSLKRDVEALEVNCAIKQKALAEAPANGPENERAMESIFLSLSNRVEAVLTRTRICYLREQTLYHDDLRTRAQRLAAELRSLYRVWKMNSDARKAAFRAEVEDVKKARDAEDELLNPQSRASPAQGSIRKAIESVCGPGANTTSAVVNEACAYDFDERDSCCSHYEDDDDLYRPGEVQDHGETQEVQPVSEGTSLEDTTITPAATDLKPEGMPPNPHVAPVGDVSVDAGAFENEDEDEYSDEDEYYQEEETQAAEPVLGKETAGVQTPDDQGEGRASSEDDWSDVHGAGGLARSGSAMSRGYRALQ